MRPLYQEVILPNLCYIGGGGEQAYWLELKAMFAKFDIESLMDILLFPKPCNIPFLGILRVPGWFLP